MLCQKKEAVTAVLWTKYMGHCMIKTKDYSEISFLAAETDWTRFVMEMLSACSTDLRFST